MCNNTRWTLSLGAVVLGMFSFMGTASAVTISSTCSSTPNVQTYVGTCALFDSSLGRLDSVTFSLIGSATISDTEGLTEKEGLDHGSGIGNYSYTGISGSLQLLYTVANTGLTGWATGNIFNKAGSFGSLLPVPPAGFVDALQVKTVIPAAIGSVSGLSYSASNVAPWSHLGGGTFTFTARNATTASATYDDNIRRDATVVGTNQWEITYNYTPASEVPEPATSVFLGSGVGLLALGLVGRRKRA